MNFDQHLEHQLAAIEADGLFKRESVIGTAQQPRMAFADGREVLNFCANNYLGLANHPQVIAAARQALEDHGFGMASVRFICGTQGQHKKLEAALSSFLGTEDTILYPSCFDANGGLFETLFTAEDAIISDALNHASIIDGIRLSKAMRFRYANNDMADLEAKLQEADSKGARFKVIATDAVFSMDGIIANLEGICDLADTYGALVMIDDCHGAGFLGARGRGTHEHCGVMDRVDIITGTLGKALGGASGGYTSGNKKVIELLRQKSRPYLFSNTIAPAVVAASLEVLKFLDRSTDLRDRLEDNTRYYRNGIEALGLEIIPGTHPIVPIMLGEARLAQEVSRFLIGEGLFVVGFFYPVVPQGKARIRTQVSAAHTREDLDFALQKLALAKAKFNL
jgi:glycine C-acetyltransferase